MKEEKHQPDGKAGNNSKVILALLAGAAIGVAIGYFLNSNKKDELLNDIKDGASKLKDNLANSFDNLKNKAEEHFKDTDI